MNVEFIPFRLGEEYENWEFDLEPYKVTKSLDMYRYIGDEVNRVLDVEVQQIILSFCLDILVAVEVQFDAMFLKSLKIMIVELVGKGTCQNEGDLIMWKDEKNVLTLTEYKRKQAVYLYLRGVEKGIQR